MKYSLKDKNHDQLVWINLNICVAITVLYFMFDFASRIFHAEEINAKWGPFAAKVLLAPFVLVFIFALFWYVFYRERKQGARLFALLSSVFMAIQGLVMLLNADLSETKINWGYFLFISYIGISHLLFAIFGKEENQAKHEEIFIIREEKNIDCSKDNYDDPADWWKKLKDKRF